MTTLGRSLAILFLVVLLGPPAGNAHAAGKVYRIGVLISGGPGPNPIGPNPGLSEFDAFTHQLRELGYVLGQNLIIDTRGAEANYDRLPALAAELIALKADLIFAPATPAARAVKSWRTLLGIPAQQRCRGLPSNKALQRPGCAGR